MTKLNIFQTLSCDLSFGLEYGSWRVSHGSLLESVGTFWAAPYTDLGESYSAARRRRRVGVA